MLQPVQDKHGQKQKGQYPVTEPSCLGEIKKQVKEALHAAEDETVGLQYPGRTSEDKKKQSHGHGQSRQNACKRRCNYHRRAPETVLKDIYRSAEGKDCQ